MCMKLSVFPEPVIYCTNWANEASPTLGCSIEILHDILYIYMYVYDCVWENNTKKSYAKMRWRNYLVQTRACSKSVLRV